MYEYYKKVFPNLKLEYLHGKMKNKEKDEIMTRFKSGDIDVLISTTVIEVGVDVPNATIMIVENAERFGLAQLHQLRGRVGRGKHKSYCILKYESKSDIVAERMKIMEQTNDGFVISEKDLELRGPGDFFGTMQHGVPEFKVANLFTDMAILKDAQECAKKIIAKDPFMIQEENQGIKEKINDLFKEKLDSYSFLQAKVLMQFLTRNIKSNLMEKVKAFIMLMAKQCIQFYMMARIICL